MISPPAGCREELQIPRSRDDGGGSYRRFHGDLIGCLGFLHRGILIGEGEGRGSGQGPHTLPRRGAGPTSTYGVSGRPSPPLRLPSGLLVPHRKLMTLTFVPSNFENI